MAFQIDVDAQLWSSLSEIEQEKIINILKDVKLLEQDGSIVTSSETNLIDAQAAVADAQSWLDDWWDRNKKALCEAGCDTAAAAAAAGCSTLSGGVAVAACLAAAEAGRRVCKDAC